MRARRPVHTAAAQTTRRPEARQRTSKCSWLSRGSMFGGMPSGPGGTVSAGLMYMFCIRIVGLMVGRLCSREQRSPCRHALLAAGSS